MADAQPNEDDTAAAPEGAAAAEGAGQVTAPNKLTLVTGGPPARQP